MPSSAATSSGCGPSARPARKPGRCSAPPRAAPAPDMNRAPPAPRRRPTPARPRAPRESTPRTTPGRRRARPSPGREAAAVAHWPPADTRCRTANCSAGPSTGRTSRHGNPRPNVSRVSCATSSARAAGRSKRRTKLMMGRRKRVWNRSHMDRSSNAWSRSRIVDVVTHSEGGPGASTMSIDSLRPRRIGQMADWWWKRRACAESPDPNGRTVCTPRWRRRVPAFLARRTPVCRNSASRRRAGIIPPCPAACPGRPGGIECQSFGKCCIHRAPRANCRPSRP